MRSPMNHEALRDEEIKQENKLADLYSFIDSKPAIEATDRTVIYRHGSLPVKYIAVVIYENKELSMEFDTTEDESRLDGKCKAYEDAHTYVEFANIFGRDYDFSMSFSWNYGVSKEQWAKSLEDAGKEFDLLMEAA